MSKKLLITGASRGIGAATAFLAAQKGYTVCINYYKNHKAAQAIQSKIQAIGGKAYLFQADVSKEADILSLFVRIDKEVGVLDGLVNNAGILGARMPLVEMDAARLQQVFATNIIGSLLCAKEAIKRMSTKFGGTGGAIINVSSAAARLGSPFEYIDYAATKGAMDTMTIGLAKEVAAEGIRVNSLRPGLIETDIHEKNRLPQLVGSVPMKRTGSPEEVARAIMWLLSDEASYVTGSIIDVTGGR
jgi:NAD(P)-dependent dehydrogenase (short-subunit alcohol dehydrogenase family)